MDQETTSRPWLKLVAFAVIYFVWGSTFLAIRVGVAHAPPLLFAAARFLIAGLCLLAWSAGCRERWPRGSEWRSLVVLAALIFLADYGLLFWAEQRVPSGIAAVMMATIPLFMAVGEIVLLRTRRMTLVLAVALLIGLVGVAVLMSPSVALGPASIDVLGAGALIVGAACFSLGSVLTRRLAMPQSRSMSSAMQMLIGGAMLTCASGALGEWHRISLARMTGGAWVALLYLILAGSVLGFTMYVWLLHHESPTRVGTYAYVNPVVAVLLGRFAGGEPLGLRTVLGSVCVLASVALMTLSPTRSVRS